MQNQCRFCKVHFQTDSQEDHVCGPCKDEVKDTITKDPKLKLELLETLLKDEIAIERIAKEIFNVPVRNIGVGGDGTIADFFRFRAKTNTRRSNS